LPAILVVRPAVSTAHNVTATVRSFVISAMATDKTHNNQQTGTVSVKNGEAQFKLKSRCYVTLVSHRE